MSFDNSYYRIRELFVLLLHLKKSADIIEDTSRFFFFGGGGGARLQFITLKRQTKSFYSFFVVFHESDNF